MKEIIYGKDDILWKLYMKKTINKKTVYERDYI